MTPNATRRVDSAVLWDARWRGHHGIGRFAREVGRRLEPPIACLDSRVRPLSLADPVYIRARMAPRRRRYFVSPGFNAGLRGSFKQLLTIHDLIHLHHPDESSAGKRLFYDRLVLPAIRQAGAVMTVSAFTRDAVAQWSGLDPDSIHIVGNGSSFEPVDTVATSRSEMVLYVGNAKPHKNLALLFRAMALMPLTTRLTLVGVTRAEASRAAVEVGLSLGRVTILSDLADSALSQLYASADCLAMPSTYEGFGLPALEAATHGTPTVYCCDAVAEVVGDTGSRCLDPRDPGEFARATLEAMASKQRSRQALTGRASQYSWDSVAERVGRAMASISDD